ncbi:uncharacterized protein LOC143910336 [Arctopsyche grandis]|uniref:uncharacterized protein LOC143910336 n=1 Tax=Arctopsyche grandis TaxID=121162 RepID=UPI00406D898C
MIIHTAKEPLPGATALKGLKMYEIGKRSTQWIQTMTRIVYLLAFVMILPVTQSYDTTIDRFLTSEHHMLLATQDKRIARGICFDSEPRDKCTTKSGSWGMEVSCSNIEPKDDLTALIEEQVQGFPNGQRTIDQLTIYGLLLVNRKLVQNWIRTSSFRINKLQIVAPEIDDIENGAFRGYAFEQLTQLSLDKVTIDTFNEGTLDGLLLERLSIVRSRINRINANALRPVAPTLEALSAEKMVLPLDLTNLTGSVTLPLIHIVDFNGNDLGRLTSRSFSALGNCKLVFLNNAKIENVGCGTFQTMPQMIGMLLINTGLTTLDSCTFGSWMINNMPDLTLYLDTNDWNCDCKLTWIKELALKNKLTDLPLCASHNCQPIRDTSFCGV